MKKDVFIIILITWLCAMIFIFTGYDHAFAQQAGHIELKCVAEKEVEIINERGENEIKRLEAVRVIPGDEVIYTISYSIKGKEMVNDIVISNPIPGHMIYKEGSATSADADTDIVFSVDNGENFDIPHKLKVVDIEGNEREAIGADYTHIRWRIKNPMKPGETGQVSYRALLE